MRELTKLGSELGIEVDLSQYLIAIIIRGDDETSAPLSDLSFRVYLVDYLEDRALLKFVFDNPLSVSIGLYPDILRIEFKDSRLFASLETGLTVTSGNR